MAIECSLARPIVGASGARSDLINSLYFWMRGEGGGCREKGVHAGAVGTNAATHSYCRRSSFGALEMRVAAGGIGFTAKRAGPGFIVGSRRIGFSTKRQSS